MGHLWLKWMGQLQLSKLLILWGGYAQKHCCSEEFPFLSSHENIVMLNTNIAVQLAHSLQLSLLSTTLISGETLSCHWLHKHKGTQHYNMQHPCVLLTLLTDRIKDKQTDVFIDYT